MKNNDNGSSTGTFEQAKLAEHAADAEILTDEDTAELPTLDMADVDDTLNEAPEVVVPGGFSHDLPAAGRAVEEVLGLLFPPGGLLQVQLGGSLRQGEGGQREHGGQGQGAHGLKLR